MERNFVFEDVRICRFFKRLYIVVARIGIYIEVTYKAVTRIHMPSGYIGLFRINRPVKRVYQAVTMINMHI